MKFKKLISVILAINIIACICIISRIHYLTIKEKKVKAKIEATSRGSDSLEDLMWERFIWVVVLLFLMIPTSGGILILMGRRL